MVLTQSSEVDAIVVVFLIKAMKIKCIPGLRPEHICIKERKEVKNYSIATKTKSSCFQNPFFFVLSHS